MDNQQIQAIANNWIDQSIQAVDDAGYAIKLSGLLLNQNKVIENAISGSLSQDNYQKIVDWIISNLPKTANSQSDAHVFETAWLIYDIGQHQGNSNKEQTEKINNFLSDLRSAYLAARISKGYGA